MVVMGFCKEYHRGEVPFLIFTWGYMVLICVLHGDINGAYPQGGIYHISFTGIIAKAIKKKKNRSANAFKLSKMWEPSEMKT